MAITQRIEWTIEAAWLSVLRASTDLVALVGTTAGIRRESDQSVADSLPCVLVRCPGATPALTQLDGYYEAPVQIVAITDMDIDTTGEARANLAGAIRDVFEDAGLESDLQTASGGTMLVFDNSTGQPDPPLIEDYPDAGKPVRVFGITYRSKVTMTPSIVNPE